MSTPMSRLQRLQKLHVSIMRHPDFCLYTGVIMSGDTAIYEFGEPNTPPIPTAFTDGVNTGYCATLMDALTDPQARFVILHENLHKAFMHTSKYAPLMKLDPMRANMAMDYFVNQILVDSDPAGTFISPPPNNAGGTGAQLCQDNKYRDWPLKKIWEDLGQQQQQQKGGKAGQGTMDMHLEPTDGNGKPLSKEELEALGKQMEAALREGKNLAGQRGGKCNRQLLEELEPKVDWRTALAEFVRSIAQGKDKTDWRRLNRRFVYQGIYLPSLVGERIGNIVVGIDTSGSIGDRELTEFSGELASVCEECNPESVTILWWDTDVHGKQVFTEENYPNMRSMLRPAGGGGTDGNCVPQFLKKEGIKPDCVIMMTDGYLGPVTGFNCPSLWFITQAKDYVPAEGVAVEFDPDA